MDSAALDEFLAVNRHLEALLQAGVPLDLGDVDAIRRYEASVAIGLGRGQALSAAIGENSDLPLAYRSAMLAMTQTSDPVLALNALDLEMTTRQSSAARSWAAIIPLFTLAILASIAFAYLVWFVWPLFASIYSQIGFEPTWVPRLAGSLRAWLPVAAFALPLATLGGWAVFRSWRRSRPAIGRGDHVFLHAHFADLVARLVSGDVPTADAVELAGGATGEATLRTVATAVATAYRRGEPLDPKQAELRVVPPLLRWAITRNGDRAPDAFSAELRFIAEFYRRSAWYAAQRWQCLGPAMVTVLLGGAIVLTYGLLVFMPIVQLLEDLAQ